MTHNLYRLVGGCDADQVAIVGAPYRLWVAQTQNLLDNNV